VVKHLSSFAVALFVATTIVFTACSGGGSPSSPTPVPTPPPSPTPTPTPTSLEMVGTVPAVGATLQKRNQYVTISVRYSISAEELARANSLGEVLLVKACMSVDGSQPLSGCFTGGVSGSTGLVDLLPWVPPSESATETRFVLLSLIARDANLRERSIITVSVAAVFFWQ